MPAATGTLAKALLKVQADLPNVSKDATNPHFRNKYVSLDALLPPTLAALNKHGVVLMQSPTVVAEGPALRTRLLHADSGDVFEDVMLLLLDKSNPQGQGSAITYARRYALMSILGLVAEEDDDGQAASRPRQQTQANGNGAASDAQAEKIEKLIKALDKGERLTEKQIRDGMRAQYGHEVPQELSKDQADDLIGRLEKAATTP